MSTKFERLFHMDALIRNGSYPSIKTFMERFEVSERTILNDIQFFKDRLNAPLTYSRSHRGYFYTDTDWKLPAFPATEGQLLAFCALIAEADVVCLAAGAGLPALWPEAPVAAVRGQITWATGVPAPAAAAWSAYLTPTRDGMLFGATYDRGDADGAWRAADDARNLAALRARLPRFASHLGGAALVGRAAVRAATSDHLPIAGEIGPGLFVLGGLGSRGFCLAPLLAEHIAARSLGAPSPLPRDLAASVDPGRFADRALRRGRLTRGDEPLFGPRG